jgi:hypothetical protein
MSSNQRRIYSGCSKRCTLTPTHYKTCPRKRGGSNSCCHCRPASEISASAYYSSPYGVKGDGKRLVPRCYSPGVVRVINIILQPPAKNLKMKIPVLLTSSKKGLFSQKCSLSGHYFKVCSPLPSHSICYNTEELVAPAFALFSGQSLVSCPVQ